MIQPTQNHLQLLAQGGHRYVCLSSRARVLQVYLPAQPVDATQALSLSAAAIPANPSIASTATIRRPHQGRMRE